MNYGRYQTQTPPSTGRSRRPFIGLLAVLAIVAVWFVLGRQHSATLAVTAQRPAAQNHCAGNKLSQTIIVSISARHLWACQQQQMVYDAKVVTGMQQLAADLTPIGTYHITAKQTNVHLKGSDTTGTWDDYVYYWLPFLANKYGQYGFHDATWRPASDFGNIDPNSSRGSHGCVELPFAASKWLYYWATVGTTVVISS